MERNLRDALSMLRDCEGALDATGSYSPEKLRALIERLEKSVGRRLQVKGR
jgi:hypothetical protein